jgi:hypothetical protein
MITRGAHDATVLIHPWRSRRTGSGRTHAGGMVDWFFTERAAPFGRPQPLVNAARNLNRLVNVGWDSAEDLA